MRLKFPRTTRTTSNKKEVNGIMTVLADAAVPKLISVDTALVLLPYLLIALLVAVSVAVIRLVLRRNKTQPPETTESSEDDVCDN